VQKWNTIFETKSKFSIDEKKVSGTASIDYLKGLESQMDMMACDGGQTKHVLFHLGNISEKMSLGMAVFINQNYSA